MIKLNKILLAIGVTSALALAPIQGVGSGTSDSHDKIANADMDQPETKAAKGKFKTMNLDIGGMVCTKCSSGVIASLKDLNGIIETDINHKGKGGTVVYDPAKLNEKKILKAINKTGFKATKRKAKDIQKAEKETMSG